MAAPNKGETPEHYRARNRDYMRSYLRRRAGRDFLNTIENEAWVRGTTSIELRDRLLATIASDDLFEAILDR